MYVCMYGCGLTIQPCRCNTVLHNSATCPLSLCPSKTNMTLTLPFNSGGQQQVLRMSPLYMFFQIQYLCPWLLAWRPTIVTCSPRGIQGACWDNHLTQLTYPKPQQHQIVLILLHTTIEYPSQQTRASITAINRSSTVVVGLYSEISYV